MKPVNVFDLSKPGVATRPSPMGGGGWAWPLNAAGTQALFEFFGEKPSHIAPIRRWAYIVEPQQAEDLAEHLRSCNVAWEVR